MFKLVGSETFSLGKHTLTIHIAATPGFDYEYTLEVDGRSLEKFTETRSRQDLTWVFQLDQVDYRAVLEKDTLDFWINGQIIEAEPEFTDDGTERNFSINNHSVTLRSFSTQHHRFGINHVLLIDGQLFPAADAKNT